MPSTRTLALGAGAIASARPVVFALPVALLVVPGVAAAQSPTAGAELGFGTRLGIRLVVSLVVYLLLGGALVGLAPGYARRMVGDLRDDPGLAFGWGLVAGIVVPIVLAVLAATIVGLIVAIPGALVLFVVGIVGSAVTVVWAGTVLTGNGVDGRSVGGGAVVLSLFAAVPVLGDFLTSLAGLFGLGVVSRDLYRSHRD